MSRTYVPEYEESWISIRIKHEKHIEGSAIAVDIKLAPGIDSTAADHARKISKLIISELNQSGLIQLTNGEPSHVTH